MTSRPPSLPDDPDLPLESLNVAFLSVGDTIELSTEDDGNFRFEVRQLNPCWLACVQSPAPYLNQSWLFLKDGILRNGEGYALVNQSAQVLTILNRVTSFKAIKARTTLVVDEEGGDPSHTQLLRAKGINVRSNRKRD